MNLNVLFLLFFFIIICVGLRAFSEASISVCITCLHHHDDDDMSLHVYQINFFFWGASINIEVCALVVGSIRVN